MTGVDVWVENSGVKAHQRLIREAIARDSPRPVVANLTGYSVETVSAHDAKRLIIQYEWLGTVGKATMFVGLLSPDRELHGVACFGHGPAGNIRTLIGEPALCLERGACVHYAPRNAASFLINAACKLVYRTLGVPIFFAYGDPMAGEYGGVYQAAGWAYLGQGLDGKKGRRRRFSVLPPGADPDNPGNWKSTRELRRAGRRMTFESAKAAGWQIASREAKHVYATNVGRERRRWLKRFRCPKYPSPNPTMKIKPHEPRDEKPERVQTSFEVVRLTKPHTPQMKLWDAPSPTPERAR